MKATSRDSRTILTLCLNKLLEMLRSKVQLIYELILVMHVVRHDCTQDATEGIWVTSMSESRNEQGENDELVGGLLLSLKSNSNHSARSIQYIIPDVYRNDSSPYDIPLDAVIPPNRTVLVQPGVVLRFADDAGFTVYGVLIVNGTKSAPVTFEPQAGRWKGIEIIDATAPSKFTFANITGSSLGITVLNSSAPSIENVISSSNDYGFNFQTPTSVRMVSSSALNNEKSGFRISSKVFAQPDHV
ncbi:hypothetical protein COOONC_06106 [Cooperia oncophora]